MTTAIRGCERSESEILLCVAVANVTHHVSSKGDIVGQLTAINIATDQVAKNPAEILMSRKR